MLTDDGRTLTIQDVKESDKGAYTCRATNDEGWDSATGQAIVLGEFGSRVGLFYTCDF